MVYIGSPSFAFSPAQQASGNNQAIIVGSVAAHYGEELSKIARVSYLCNICVICVICHISVGRPYPCCFNAHLSWTSCLLCTTSHTSVASFPGRGLSPCLLAHDWHDKFVLTLWMTRLLTIRTQPCWRWHQLNTNQCKCVTPPSWSASTMPLSHGLGLDPLGLLKSWNLQYNATPCNAM